LPARASHKVRCPGRNHTRLYSQPQAGPLPQGSPFLSSTLDNHIRVAHVPPSFPVFILLVFTMRKWIVDCYCQYSSYTLGPFSLPPLQIGHACLPPRQGPKTKFSSSSSFMEPPALLASYPCHYPMSDSWCATWPSLI
jgi:hypothetical protein